MNEADGPKLQLKNVWDTVEVLLELGQVLGDKKAPNNPYDLFLRKGGLSISEFIQFVAAVEKTFRIVLPTCTAGDTSVGSRERPGWGLAPITSTAGINQQGGEVQRSNASDIRRLRRPNPRRPNRTADP